MRSWFHEIAPRARREEAMACLDRVGLADLGVRRADQLSGGQSQRVAIARALMQQARVIFADEPVASLDPAAGEEVMELFRDLVRRDGLTLLFTTHNVRHALDYADRVVGLRHGRVAIDAASADLNPTSLRSFYE
jgi:phosphonate transport system ATP-binding protein